MNIGFLATGDELTSGDILNTDGQIIANTLFEKGFELGSHVIAPDDETSILKAIDFLLQNHSILIITGGLGPTSDDCTRYALAKALNKELFFHTSSWEKLVARLSRYKLQIHESNRQQALFPQGAIVLVNPNGTANGCVIEDHDKIIFMLPGPPSECLPMFQNEVLPFLQSRSITTSFQNFKWRLFGVSEGEIAAKLDNFVDSYFKNQLESFSHSITGYRWDYPYLEFKLRLPLTIDAQPIINLIEAEINSHLICTAELTASELLIDYLQTYAGKLAIIDECTGGFLEYKLSLPEIRHKLIFHPPEQLDENIVVVKLSGLAELWNKSQTNSMSEFKITIKSADALVEKTKQLIYRDRRIVSFVVEYTAFEILNFLKS